MSSELEVKVDLASVARELGLHLTDNREGRGQLREMKPDGTYIDGMGRTRTKDRNAPLLSAEMRLHFAELLGLLQQGETVVRACKMIGVPYYQVRKHFLNNPEFQGFLKEAGDEAFARVKEEIVSRTTNLNQRAADLAEDALSKMESLLHESSNEHIQFKVAQDLLDRDPRLSRTKRVDGAGATIKLEANILLLAAAAAREIESPGSPGSQSAKLTSREIPVIEIRPEEESK